jgi:gas vesicle protein
MSNKNSLGTLIGGLLIGGTIGTIVGLSIAPRSGRETRKILKKSADALPELVEDLSTSLQIQANRCSNSVWQNLSFNLVRLRQAISAGIEASQIATEKESTEISAN